ncbi:MAG: hypothetical protein QOD70_3166 [Frankiales bacterium]|nr:hypothetical protein [Frankiales bacterium]
MVAARRLCTSLVAAAAAVSLTAPALADNVSVTLTGAGGTRQFSVEDLNGNPLTALDLGTGSSQPFKLHVADSSFLPAAGQSGYTVSATMSNLYLKKSDGTYNYAVKVPSSELSVGFGSNPLSIAGLSLVDLPRLSIGGTLASCASPLTDLPAFALSLGVPLGSLTAGAVTALTTLCTTIGASAAPVTAVVDGALRNISNLIPTSVLDTPTALSGAYGGSFTNPSYAAGTVGAGDTAGATGAPSATSLPLMQGTQNLSAALASLISGAVSSALTGVGAPPLVAGSGAAATTAESITTKLATAGIGTVSAALGQALQAMASPDQLTAINTLFHLTGVLTPLLADIHAVTGNYYSVPVLTANPRTPVAGTYGGTMTVTFVQS